MTIVTLSGPPFNALARRDNSPRPLPGRARLRRRGLAALGLGLLLGCEPPGPTGIHGVLFFGRSGSPYVGQTQTITIPRLIHAEGHSLGRLWYRSRTYRYEFTGTTIAVRLPAGAALVSAALGAEGYAVEVRCDAEAGPDLWVTILADGVPRYEDGTSLRCYAPPRVGGG